MQVAREIFADRNYLSDGWLVPRTRPDALLRDPKEAAERVLRMLREGKVRSVEGGDVEVRGETICVHGDTPGAVEFARELRSRLERDGVRISAPQRLVVTKKEQPWSGVRTRAESQTPCGPSGAALHAEPDSCALSDPSTRR